MARDVALQHGNEEVLNDLSEPIRIGPAGAPPAFVSGRRDAFDYRRARRSGAAARGPRAKAGRRAKTCSEAGGAEACP
ncbi:MAG: hypothetical protein WB820_00730, partial [Rhodoplanes sp.]